MRAAIRLFWLLVDERRQREIEGLRRRVADLRGDRDRLERMLGDATERYTQAESALSERTVQVAELNHLVAQFKREDLDALDMDGEIP